MKFITTPDLKEGTRALADKIVSFLKDGKRTLWLVPGGSNIPITADALNIIRSKVSPEELSKLTIAQVDERYGPVGHPDSNWKQFLDTKVNLDGVMTLAWLDGSSLEDTVARYGKLIDGILPNIEVIVGQFGMGADGHIAGILPHTPAVTATGTASGYESKPFTRVSLTFPILRKINIAYMFVSFAGKKEAIENLHKDISLADQPAQILKEIPEVYVYID